MLGRIFKGHVPSSSWPVTDQRCISYLLLSSGEAVCGLMQALGQAQQIDEMLQLLADAWSGATPLRPSIYACNSAVGACARAGRLDEALRLCSAMVRFDRSMT